MSEEPQPLRLKPRPQSAGGPPAGPAPGSPPAAAPPEQTESTSRLRLKPRLNIVEEPLQQVSPAEPESPAPASPAAVPLAVPPAAPSPSPEPDDAPKFKLRPKAVPVPVIPVPIAPVPADLPRPPPPSAPVEAAPPADEPSPEPPARSSVSMPPMSVLSAPPAPGSVADAGPAAPIPRLSLANPQDTSTGLAKGAMVRTPDGQLRGARPPPVKPGKPSKKPGAVLRRRPTLSPVAKAGIGVLVIAMAVGGVFTYRIFFPAPARVVPIKALPYVKPFHPGDFKKTAAAALSKAVGAPARMIEAGQAKIAAHRDAEQARVDVASIGIEAPPLPTPTPTPNTDATQAVLAQTNVASDVKVNNTPIMAAPTASAAFRTFVANASIGGVFQGSPSKALINGRIVREGQVLDSELAIAFDRVDADRKMIYFRDATGAQVSKNY